MSKPIEDMDDDTIEVAAYAPGALRPVKDGSVVLVEIEEHGTGSALVHLTHAAARDLIRELKLAVKNS